MKKTKVKTSKGITLIALIITIVLLILAGISIATLVGENGILTKADTAKVETKKKQIEEEAKLVKLEMQIEAEAKNEPLTKENLITALKEKFKGSTIEDERVVVENGLYDIVVAENLQITVVKHGEGKTDTGASEIGYIIEDIDGSSKAVTLYRKVNYFEGLSTEDLEQIISICLEVTYDETVRAEIQLEAKEENMEYHEYLIFMMKEAGLEEVVQLEKVAERVLGQTIDSETREQLSSQGASLGWTYAQTLNVVIGDKANEYSDGTIFEAKFKNETIEVSKEYTDFIATKNGTYTINATTEDGRKLSTTIEIEDIVEEKFSEIYDETDTYTDANGKTATIPAGFAVGETSTINTIANGLVITDAVDSEGYSIGNEFVWIPVDSEDVFARTDFDISTGLPTNQISDEYVEPYEDGYGTEKEEYDKMKSQVLEHDGFYIGRYEAGDATNGVNKRTEATEAHEVVIKKGVIPYNYITWGESVSEIGTNGAAYLSKNMYAESTSVTSTLCYGSQWDAMCKFIGEDSKTMALWYKTRTIAVSGINGKVDKFNNMFDLAVGCSELTMEVNSSSRVKRRRK